MTSLEEKSEQVSLTVFKCPHCGGILGSTTNNILYIGAVKHKRSISPTCGYCEKVVHWRPSNESFNKK